MRQLINLTFCQKAFVRVDFNVPFDETSTLQIPYACRSSYIEEDFGRWR